MRVVDRIARIVAVVLLFITWSDTQAADFAPPSADGWYGWQVQGFEAAQRAGEPLRIFVRMRDGEAVQIRMQTHHCWDGGVPAEFVNLGEIDNAASFAWLKSQVMPRSKLTDDALFALAAHDGDEVFDFFDQLISRSTK